MPARVPAQSSSAVSETKRARVYAALTAATVVGLLVVLTWRSPATLTVSHQFLAGGIVALGVTPLVTYLLKLNPDEFPLLSLHGLFYAVTFGLPALSRDNSWRSATGDSIESALWLTLTGLGVLYGGYLLARVGLFARTNPVQLPKGLGAQRLSIIGGVLLGGNIAQGFIPVLQHIPSVSQFLFVGGWAGITVLYSMHLRGTLSRAMLIAFWGGAMPLVVMSRLASGALAQAMFVVVLLGVIFWQERRKLPLRYIVITIVVFAILNPIKHEFRLRTWGPRPAVTSAAEKVALFAELTVSHYKREGAEGIFQSPDYVLRLSNVSVFAHVIELTPSSVPYWQGQTYADILTSFIPRLIYPEKPSRSYANIFGRRYRLLNPEDRTTSLNLPWIVEFYANYGARGVLFGMAVVGVVFGFLVQKLGAGKGLGLPGERRGVPIPRDPNEGVLQRAFGLTVIFGLFYAESNLAQMWGGLIPVAVTYYVAIKLLAVRI